MQTSKRIQVFPHVSVSQTFVALIKNALCLIYDAATAYHDTHIQTDTLFAMYTPLGLPQTYTACCIYYDCYRAMIPATLTVFK